MRCDRCDKEVGTGEAWVEGVLGEEERMCWACVNENFYRSLGWLLLAVVVVLIACRLLVG